MGISFGGVVSGGLAGLGGAVADVAQSQIDYGHKADLASQMMQLEVQKQKLIEQNQVEMGNQQRSAQTARIGAAKSGLIESGMAKQYGSSDAAVAAADAGLTDAPLTAEQKAVIGKAKDDTRAALDNNDTFVKAAIQTGDIAPKDVMSATSRQDIAQLRADNQNNIWQQRLETLNAIADSKETSYRERTVAQAEIAWLKGEMKAMKDGGGSLDLKGTLGYMHSLDNDIRSNSQELAGLMKNAQKEFDPDEKTKLNKQMDSLRTDTKEKQNLKRRLAKLLPGGLGDEETPAAPAPADNSPLGQIGRDMQKSGLTSSTATLAGQGQGAVALDAGGSVTFTPKAGNTSAPPVISKADYDKLPPGAVFTAPDGSRRVKP